MRTSRYKYFWEQLRLGYFDEYSFNITSELNKPQFERRMRWIDNMTKLKAPYKTNKKKGKR